jgi:hypothetical protein
MRFLLVFVLSFVSLFAIAQAPPMAVGGPQGITSARINAQSWLSVPIYVDTPVAPLVGIGWPPRGFVIQTIKNYRDITIEEYLKWAEVVGLTQVSQTTYQDNFGTVYTLPNGIDSSQVASYILAGDTAIWHYTGRQWKRVGGNAEFYFNNLINGGFVTQVAPISSRKFTISAAEYIISGVKYKYDTTQTLIAPAKVADSTGRIDVITLRSYGAVLLKGTPSTVPLKPRVGGDEIELTSIYYAPFSTVPSVIGSGSKGVSSIFRVPGKDSIFYTVDTLKFAIKDSIGISKNDTAAMLNPYKFGAANGLTRDSTIFRLGGTLNQNTNINLNTRRLTFIGGSDTTRIFSNARVSIGGTPDSTYMLNVNGNTRVTGYLDLLPSFNNSTAVIRNQASNDGSIMFVGQGSVVSSTPPTRNVIIDPVTRNYSSLTGSGNTLIGRFTGQTLTNGVQNTFIGLNAGYGVTTGSNNIMILNNNGPVPYTSSVSSSIIMSPSLSDSSIFGLTNRYAYIGGGSETNTYINDFYFGGGHRVRFPNTASLNFYAPSAWPSKADTIGSDFTINAGRGSGTGLGGSVIFRTSSPTTSGTTLQTLSERARITPAGNLLVGAASDGAFRLDVNGGAKMDSLVVDSLYAKFGSYTGDGSVPFAPIEFRATSGNRARIDLRPASNAGWNSNWYGAITHNGTETDILFANYGNLYIGNSFWAAGGGIYLGNTRNNPSMYIRNNNNVLIGDTANTGFRFDVNGMARVRDTLTLSTTPVTADTSANDLLVINSSNGQVRRFTGDWYSVPLTGSAPLNFPSTGHGNSADLTFTLTGAAEGDVVALGIPNASIVANGSFIAWVSATDTITVRFNNYASSGNSDPASGTFKIKVFK